MKEREQLKKKKDDVWDMICDMIENKERNRNEIRWNEVLKIVGWKKFAMWMYQGS